MQILDRFTLPNGLRVVGERLPHMRSVTIGIWVRTGSANETPAQKGYSHFVEHMVFKGTASRNSRQIAEEMDFLGGQMNAFTSKECTCFYTKVMDRHLDRAIDLLADITLNPSFPSDELEKEKGVILEEIAMGEDMPEDIVHEQLAVAMFGDHPLGGPILGPAQNIIDATRDSLLGFMKGRYLPQNAVVSVAGNYDMAQLQALLEQAFGAWGGSYSYEAYPPVDFAPTQLFREKDLEQSHICIAYPSIAMGDEASFSMMILNNLFGGSMSSRLFQTIREEAGLAYSVYSFPTTHALAGIETLYAGTSPKTAQKVVDLMGAEIRRLLSDGIPKDEFEKSREQIRGSYILSMESGNAKMNAMGRGTLLLNRFRSEDEYLQRLDAASLEEAYALAKTMFARPFGTSVVGPQNLDFSSLLV